MLFVTFLINLRYSYGRFIMMYVGLMHRKKVMKLLLFIQNPNRMFLTQDRVLIIINVFEFRSLAWARKKRLFEKGIIST